MRSIYVIDDEEPVRLIISEYLMREGFKVETFSSVQEVLLRLQAAYPDMFIVDILLPGQEGLTFCREIRERSGLPIIFVCDRGDENGRLMDLELGGDDYLTKPLSPRELVARVRSLFRHSALPMIAGELVQMGNLTINPNDRHTTVDAQEVYLTPMEYELLLLLAQQPQRTFNRQELLDRVWGCEYVGDLRAVDDLVKRLRRKLRGKGSSKNVKTIWGYGYRFDE
ncbi:MAG TPA: response regulator transcription factor [Syntrophomonadaceae bacterium]|nr:response regulator transcription factor [Syntrophomonadaceae bacterium]